MGGQRRHGTRQRHAIPAPGPAARAASGQARGRLDAGRDPRRPAAHHRGDAGPVRAADGEPRGPRRRRLPEGLLSRPGDRRARPVPRPGEAADEAVHRARRLATQARRGVQWRRGGGQRRRRGPRRGAGVNYYVYYKVPAERTAALRALVAQLFDEVKRQTGIKGRWLRRRDDPATYMEIYEGVKDAKAFEALLEREGAKLGVPRKLEVFISAETPA